MLLGMKQDEIGVALSPTCPCCNDRRSLTQRACRVWARCERDPMKPFRANADRRWFPRGGRSRPHSSIGRRQCKLQWLWHEVGRTRGDPNLVTSRSCSGQCDRKGAIREWRIWHGCYLHHPVVRGWLNYYGRFYRSKCVQVLRHFNEALGRWARRKYKRFKPGALAARRDLCRGRGAILVPTATIPGRSSPQRRSTGVSGLGSGVPPTRPCGFLLIHWCIRMVSLNKAGDAS